MTRTDDGVPHYHTPEELHNDDVAHEHSDVDIRALLMYGLGMFVIIGIVHGLMWLLFGFLERQALANDPKVSPLSVPAAQMPANTVVMPAFGGALGPQLLTNEYVALSRMREVEEQRLKGIEEAKKQLLQRGVPVRGGEPVDPALGTFAPAMGEASGGRAIATARPPKPAAPPAQANPAAKTRPGEVK